MAFPSLQATSARGRVSQRSVGDERPASAASTRTSYRLSRSGSPGCVSIGSRTDEPSSSVKARTSQPKNRARSTPVTLDELMRAVRHIEWSRISVLETSARLTRHLTLSENAMEERTSSSRAANGRWPAWIDEMPSMSKTSPAAMNDAAQPSRYGRIPLTVTGSVTDAQALRPPGRPHGGEGRRGARSRLLVSTARPGCVVVDRSGHVSTDRDRRGPVLPPGLPWLRTDLCGC